MHITGRRRLLDRNGSPSAKEELASSYTQKAKICKAEGSRPDARAAYEEALRLRLDIARETNDADAWLNVFLLYYYLGHLCHETGAYGAACKYYQKVVSLLASHRELYERIPPVIVNEIYCEFGDSSIRTGNAPTPRNILNWPTAGATTFLKAACARTFRSFAASPIITLRATTGQRRWAFTLGHGRTAKTS